MARGQKDSPETRKRKSVARTKAAAAQQERREREANNASAIKWKRVRGILVEDKSKPREEGA